MRTFTIHFKNTRSNRYDFVTVVGLTIKTVAAEFNTFCGALKILRIESN
jgi:hypothetical protein